jgi:hypothetical protein
LLPLPNPVNEDVGDRGFLGDLERARVLRFQPRCMRAVKN